MALLFVVASFLLYPGWLKPGVDRRWITIGMTVVAYGAYAAAVRFGERRPPAEIAPRPLLPELLIGMAIGTGMFTLVFASLRLLGVYTMAPGIWGDWPADAIGALRTGFAEELMLRLIVFRLLIRAFGLPVALAASALLFGVLHLANPNATWFASIAIAVEAGLMLAAFYLLTGRIWMAVGVQRRGTSRKGRSSARAYLAMPSGAACSSAPPSPTRPRCSAAARSGPRRRCRRSSSGSRSS